MTNIYCIRANSGKYTENFVSGGYAAIDFHKINGSLKGIKSEDEIYKLLIKAYPKKRKNVISQYTGEINRFLFDLQAGDIIITPKHKKLYWGLVKNNRYFYFKGNDGCPSRHRKSIDWNSEPLLRDNMSTAFRRTLTAWHSVFFVKHNDEFLKKILLKNDVSNTDDDFEGFEGKTKNKIKKHKIKERDLKFRSKYRKSFSHIVDCPACSVNASTKYSIKSPNRFLEMHHIIPLKYVDKVIRITKADVILLCPNCHKAIHRMMSENDKKTIRIEDFRKIIKKNSA